MTEPQFGEWQPIASAPKDGTAVLLWTTDIIGANGRACVGRWGAYNGAWWDVGMEYTLNHPTHWMPLPPSPSSSKESK